MPNPCVKSNFVGATQLTNNGGIAYTSSAGALGANSLITVNNTGTVGLVETCTCSPINNNADITSSFLHWTDLKRPSISGGTVFIANQDVSNNNVVQIFFDGSGLIGGVAGLLPAGTFNNGDLLEFDNNAGTETIKLNGVPMATQAIPLANNTYIQMFQTVGLAIDNITFSRTCCSTPLLTVICPRTVNEGDIVNFDWQTSVDTNDGGAGGTFDDATNIVINNYTVPAGSGGTQITITGSATCNATKTQSCALNVTAIVAKTLDVTKKVNLVNGANTQNINLPAPVNCDINEFYIRRLQAGNTTLIPASGLIDGLTSKTYPATVRGIHIYWTGTTWHTLSTSES